ncbi:MAG: NAD(P)-binding protein [Acidimicrobiaceae bacterium]|nr:NAD(P)-binding protein [Acidimicrobiaceae bacterium]
MAVNGLRVGVVGGSIGGLTAAVLLHEMGCDVQVFERSTEALQGRGAGIVVLPMTERYFTESGTGLRASQDWDRQVALTLTYWSYIDRAGSIIDAAATHNRFTSWNTLYRALLERLPPERYHLGCSATGVSTASDSATVHFAEGGTDSLDLVVGADGIGSTVRETVAPGTPTTYAGYVAWRGTVLERDLSPSSAAVFVDAMVYQVLDRSHVLVYAIPGPGDSAEAGERALNFVWYRNARGTDYDELMTDRHGVHRPATMPPGLVRERFVQALHADASAQLAPQLAELVQACDQPFIQAIFDMTADRFRRGRAILIGDAAAALRPHVAAGTAKACADGWALRDFLAGADGIDEALAGWEAQQLALARRVAAKSRAMGEAAQTTGTMVPGDPDWRFGLFGPGN